MKKVCITDLDIIKNQLDRGVAWLSFYIDRKVGFKTQLVYREYDHIDMVHKFYVTKFKETL